jgi:hypothetical protein
LCTWIPLLCYRTCSFQYETAICDVMVRLACSSQSSVVNQKTWISIILNITTQLIRNKSVKLKNWKFVFNLTIIAFTCTLDPIELYDNLSVYTHFVRFSHTCYIIYVLICKQNYEKKV